MAQELIDIGALADDGTGDTIRNAGRKINANFTEVYALPAHVGDIKFRGNNITSESSNADIVLSPSGTGNVVFPALTFEDNNIKPTRSNDDLKITPNGAGKVIIGGLAFSGTSISAPDSTSININENLIVDGSATFGGTFTFSGAQTFPTGSVFATQTYANGSITDSTGAISFGNENLTTTGTLSAGTGSALGNITFANGSITDSSGAIAFGNENLSTTGTITAGSGSTFGNLTLANGSITDSSGAISFGNENLTTTATSIAINSTLTVANGSITDSSGAISFGDENVTTTGTIARATGSTIGNLTLANGSITSASGAIDFGNEDLTTSASSMAIGSTMTAGSGTITDTTGAISFGNDNLTTTGTLDVSGLSTLGSLTTVSGATSFAGSTTIDSLTFNDNIIGTSSNADLNLTPGGTGVVNVSNLTIDSSINLTDNVIKVTRSNDHLVLSGNGTGSTQISNIDLDSGTIDNTVIGAATPAAGTFTTVSFTNTEINAGQLNIKDNQITVNTLNADLEINASGSGNVLINDFSWPNSYAAGQFIKTDASKNLSLVTFPILYVESDIADGTVTITGDSSTQTIDSSSAATHRSVKYLIQMSDSTADRYALVEANVSHDGSNAYISSFARVGNGQGDGSTAYQSIVLSADISGGNVRLRGTVNNTNNQVIKFVKRVIKV